MPISIFNNEKILWIKLAIICKMMCLKTERNKIVTECISFLKL